MSHRRHRWDGVPVDDKQRVHLPPGTELPEMKKKSTVPAWWDQRVRYLFVCTSQEPCSRPRLVWWGGAEGSSTTWNTHPLKEVGHGRPDRSSRWTLSSSSFFFSCVSFPTCHGELGSPLHIAHMAHDPCSPTTECIAVGYVDKELGELKGSMPVLLVSRIQPKVHQSEVRRSEEAGS